MQQNCGQTLTSNYQLGRDRPVLAVERRNYNAPAISIGALWHIKNEFCTLPVTQGSSFFKIDPNTNLISKAYEFPEPAVTAGSTGLKLLSVASKIVGRLALCDGATQVGPGGFGGGDVHTERGGSCLAEDPRRQQSCGGAQCDCSSSLAMARQRRQLGGGSRAVTARWRHSAQQRRQLGRSGAEAAR